MALLGLELHPSGAKIDAPVEQTEEDNRPSLTQSQ